MLAMILTDEKIRWVIDRVEGRDLEGKLKETPNGKKWTELVKSLTEFYTSSPSCVGRLVITTEQLNFLKTLV
jgi:hypothetical protein